jgi:AcrR family transcriptional regulator
VFTEKSKPKRGRPSGQTEQGAAMRERLFEKAVELIAAKGYEAATLRELAAAAQVSPALLYKYFPSKRAVLLELYERLSAEHASRCEVMRPGRWRDRFLFALRTSLAVLEPSRKTIVALTPVLAGDPDEGVFSRRLSGSRLRVQAAFVLAVVGASDSPARPLADALGRLLYLLHMAVLLFWLLDKSLKQRATAGIIALIAGLLPVASLSLRLPATRRAVLAADSLASEGLFSS